MYLMNLNPTGRVTKINHPLEVIERLRAGIEDEAGIRTVFLTVVDQPAPPGVRNILANAFCDFVEFDYATRDAAAQWLLDWCNVKYGGGE
jgi:hypothetical protein